MTASSVKRPPPQNVVSSDSKRALTSDKLESTEVVASGEQKEARRPKRKVGVLIGYCGTGYHGMQVNPPHKTIEGELFEAFVKAGAISKDNSDDLKKSSFIRAARTDKGVHAAGNVVSLKLIVEDDDVVEKINSHLPEQIRVWSYSRTNKSFECRKCCSSRIYEYMLPTYTLMSPKPSTPLGQRLANASDYQIAEVLKKEAAVFWDAVHDELGKEGVTPDEILAMGKLDNEKGEATGKEAKATENGDGPTLSERKQKLVRSIENKHRRAYRALPERIDELREVLKIYEGVHNFHNFTVGKGYNDPSAMRVMKSLTVSDPKLINGTEWVSIKIHGQSFMLHQIRKMIAMAVLIVRLGVPRTRVAGLFEDIKIGIPKAPALGLLLEQPKYDAYNERLAKLGRPSITFDPYEQEMEAFKSKHIYDKIYAQEAKENEFHAFFAFIDTYRVSELLDYLTGTKSEAPADLVALEESEEEEASQDGAD